MQPLGQYSNKYLETLKKRSLKSRTFKSYQLVGLEIAAILGDFKNKSLYIKLAKEYNESKLLGLAKSVAENRTIKNPGAYFMSILYSKDDNSHPRQQKGK